MPYEIYKILHLVGIFLLVSGLVGLLALVWSGHGLTGRVKTFAFITHGVGLLFILVSGFGLLARLGIAQQGLPPWIHVKLFIWIVFGGLIALLKRKGQMGWPLYFIMLAIFTVAAYYGIYKPV